MCFMPKTFRSLGQTAANSRSLQRFSGSMSLQTVWEITLDTQGHVCCCCELYVNSQSMLLFCFQFPNLLCGLQGEHNAWTLFSQLRPVARPPSSAWCLQKWSDMFRRKLQH